MNSNTIHLKGPQVHPTPGFMLLPFEKYTTIVEMYFLYRYSYYIILYNILLSSNCCLIFHPNGLSYSIIYCMFLFGIKSSQIKSTPPPKMGSSGFDACPMINDYKTIVNDLLQHTSHRRSALYRAPTEQILFFSISGRWSLTTRAINMTVMTHCNYYRRTSGA